MSTVWGCARHAQLGPTCCEYTEILLTEGDKVRIATHTGLEDFWEEVLAAGVYVEHDPDDPAWLLGFHEDGTRPILKHAEEGRCTFLGERGCSLPMEVRPILCRLHPFLFAEHGFVGLSSGCPSEVVPHGSTLVETLEMEHTTADRWRRLLYLELRAWPRRPSEAIG